MVLLRSLGVKTPDFNLVVRQCILPKYHDNKWHSLTQQECQAHLEYLKFALDSMGRVEREDVLTSCRQHLRCYTRVGQSQLIQKCHIWSPELEELFQGCWGQVPSVQCIAEEHFQLNTACSSTRESWVIFFLLCGASAGLRLDEQHVSYHHNLREPERKRYAAFPLQHTPTQVLPRTFNCYKAAWPCFPADVEVFLRVEATMVLNRCLALLSLLDRVWDQEYADKLTVRMTSHHMSHRDMCMHGFKECMECTTTTVLHIKHEQDLGHIPFLKSLREMIVPTSSGESLRLQDTFHRSPEIADLLGDSLPFVQVTLQSTDLLRACGICQTVNAHTVLKRLRQVVEAHPKLDFECMGAACKLYKLLDQAFGGLFWGCFLNIDPGMLEVWNLSNQLRSESSLNFFLQVQGIACI
jgi:hypothetical protein